MKKLSIIVKAFCAFLFSPFSLLTITPEMDEEGILDNLIYKKDPRVREAAKKYLAQEPLP